jgi:hypothetical protein
MRVQRVSQVRSGPVSWFWVNRLAQGKLATLDGDPGLGKSLVALDLCARLSTGRPMPDGSPGLDAGNALVLNAEDGVQDTTRPRLEALGADLGRVFVLRPEDELELRLPRETETLARLLRRTRARLLVLDPFVAFLDGSAWAGNDQGIRRALLPLWLLAKKHGCAVLLIRHLTKQARGRALYRGGGSIGFVGTCRAGLLVAPDPAAPARRVLAPVKNTLGPLAPSLTFALEGEAGQPPRLTWLGTSPLTADDLVAGGAAALPRSTPRDRACDFLAAFLEDGPRTAREIWEAARPQGLTERTLYRARQELQVQVQLVQDKATRVNYWLLPGQKLSEEDPYDLEPWLAPLREKYPPSTPLDDL